ncbi:MAG: lysine--tRNA ligase [Candidatus Aenigmarchaeota archaeon]|nr:lysine--tRNA ligase [Candidatus Aenigmarchaeota archaeon]
MTEIEHYTWADKIVDYLRNRNVKKHVVHGMWTPSGYFHIGNARPEIMTPGLAYKAIRDAGLPVEFNFFVDDFDDLDKVPANLNTKDFEEYLGKPLYEVPSPVDGYKSWADFFTSEIREVMHIYDLKPEWYSSYENYQRGVYDEAIVTVLNNWKKARDIIVRITKSQKPENWIPIMPICENCGRSATTVATEWDGQHLRYACIQKRDYATGCNYEGEMKPEKGNSKLPWKIHWPATWHTFSVTFEIGGKDHFSSGGSVETGKVLQKEIFGTEPPVMIGTEFIQIDNKKISGSLGNVISLKQWLGFAEPELLRFLYVSYQPNTVINIDVKSQKFFLLTDRYDEAERCYYGDQSISEKRTEQLKRQYVLSQVSEPPKEAPVQLSYSIAAMIAQMLPNKSVDAIASLLQSMGTIKKKELTEYDMNRLSSRLALAKHWICGYAPDDMKIHLNKEAPASAMTLNDNEKAAVSAIIKDVEKKITEAELQSRIYDVAREHGVEPKRFFQILYQLLISKDSGPRLGPFMLALGKDHIKKILSF